MSNGLVVGHPGPAGSLGLAPGGFLCRNLWMWRAMNAE